MDGDPLENTEWQTWDIALNTLLHQSSLLTESIITREKYIYIYKIV